ncbi:MAG: pentapeptide repeat-containing protein [Acidimicrobiia bacterium]
MTPRSGTRRPPNLEHELAVAAVNVVDGAEISDTLVVGDLSELVASGVEWTGCRFDAACLVGTRLEASRLVDCVLTGCDLSGLVFDQGSCTRVEFRGCRLSGVQAAGGRFRDVAFVDCRLDAANFRMSRWDRAEFDGCDLAEVDLYGAEMPACRFARCDMSGAHVSKSNLSGARFARSRLDGITGADALQGIAISSDQLIPVALAVFAARAIVVDDSL